MKKFFLILLLLFTFGIAAGTGETLTSDSSTLIDDYIDMARIYTSSAQYKKALEYIDTIDKISPKNPKILYEKAVILKNYNQPILARNLMREVATIAPEYKESYLYKEFFKDDIPGFYSPKEYDANYYTKKGLEFLDENKIEKAIEYLKKAVELNDNVEALNNLGVAYMKSSMPNQAVKYFQKVLLTDSQNANAYLNLGIYYTEIEPDDKKLLSNFKRAIKFNSNNPSPYYHLGNYYSKKGLYETAVEYYRIALAKDDTDIDIYYALGDTLFKLNQYDEAYSVFEKSLMVELDSAKVYEKLAQLAIYLNKNDEADGYIRKAIELNPTSANYMQLAKILYNKGDYASSLNIMNTKIADSKNAEMYNYIGLCNFQIGNYKTALTNFIKATTIKAKPSYYYNLAICYNALSDKANMQKYIDSALYVQPQEVQDYLDVIKIYQDLGKQENIILTADKAIQAYPDERQFYTIKLKVLQQMGKTAEYNIFNLKMQEEFKKDAIYLGK